MCATEVEMPCGIFKFSGQSRMDTYAIDVESLLPGLCSYDDVMVGRVRLCLEAIRAHAAQSRPIRGLTGAPRRVEG